MLTKLISTFSLYIRSGDTLIVGVSGGPDSTALLHLLIEWRQQLLVISSQLPITFVVAHVNHGIRGRAALRDEAFVRALAKSHKLKCEVKSVKLAGKSGLEERGRKIRREFFEKLRDKYNAKWILTAHTEDDQFETILLNFLRGSGPVGLAGMKIKKGAYLKPLLTTPKSEILAYLKIQKFKFCRDETNNDTKFRRNFIRKKILPLLLQVNPSLQKTLLRNSELFANVDAWIKKEAREFLEKHRKGLELFDRKDFEKLPEAIQCEVIQEAYRRATGTFYNISLVRVQEIRRMIEKGIGNKKIILPLGVFLLNRGQLELQASEVS